MRDLTTKERRFFESLLKLKPQKNNGYYRFTKGNKHYKRSRVLMQLHLNKKLSIFDFVHHIDKNKENDNLKNLQIVDKNTHANKHNIDKRKYPKECIRNRIPEEEIKRIKRYYSNGLNYNQIGKKVKRHSSIIGNIIKKSQ